MNQYSSISRLGIPAIPLILTAALLVPIVGKNLGGILGLGQDAGAVLTIVAGFAFMMSHGRIALDGKCLAAFIVSTVAISFCAEAIGVTTGAVYGRYFYTEKLGPKFLGVPFVIQIAYLAMGYASFMTARVAMDAIPTPYGWRRAGVVIATAFFMTAWDLAMDPHMSTFGEAWIWRDGGAWFGVPLHNYIGWLVTVALFTSAYLWFEAAHPLPTSLMTKQGKLFWSMPIIYYGILGIKIVIAPLLYRHNTNAQSHLNAMQSLALVAFFVMGIPTLFALWRLIDDSPLDGTFLRNQHASR